MINELKAIKDVYSKRHRNQLKIGVKQIITETDGCMMPIVETNPKVKDKRKKKKLMYKEARLCLSYKDGDVTPVFAVTMDDNLPIGSGKVEGGHRHVIQSRLKISGAWWLKDSANAMLALRTTRINNQWENYWKNI